MTIEYSSCVIDTNANNINEILGTLLNKINLKIGYLNWVFL